MNDTKMIATLILIFKENTDMDIICNKIGLKAANYSNTDRTTQNEKTREKYGFGFSAYWEYSITEMKSSIVDEPLQKLYFDVSKYIPQIQNALSFFNGSAKIDMKINANTYDALSFYLSRDVIKFASDLNAEIDMDTYIDDGYPVIKELE